MPWQEVSIVDQRCELVALARADGANRRELFRRFGVSAQTGYKWLRRAAAGDELVDRSRRPHRSPGRTAGEMEAAVLAVRDAHPSWGARKLAAVLARDGKTAPATSTVHAILQRHGRIVPPAGGAPASGRFERAAPNELWQMDFKGRFRLGNGRWCHPLTVVDDHSRYALALEACADETGATVRERLEPVFRRYGLPAAIFVDNGSPWGPSNAEQRWTRFAVWLVKLGVDLLHSRPYHPQSRGKNERFHRTLIAELLAFRPLADLAQAERAFADWRLVYNSERPHQALGQQVPASRYRTSPRAMPDRLPEVAYDSTETVRRVPASKDYIAFKGRLWKVPQAFRGELLALRPTAIDGCYDVYFAAHKIADIDLRSKPDHHAQPVNHVPEHASAMSPG
jgi:transposase InsO family protein